MTEHRLEGRSAAPGMALGVLVRLHDGPVQRLTSGDPAAEAGALKAAISAALNGLADLLARSGAEGGAILEFQVAMLEDDLLSAPAFGAIAAGRPAHEAWREALDAEVAGYDSAEEEYFRARAADLRDIRDRVLAHLSGSPHDTQLPPGAIVAGDDMAPSRFLSIDWSRGGALALMGGSPTSHVAMLARSRGVPAVVGLGPALAEMSGEVLVDAYRGVVVAQPGAATLQAFHESARARQAADIRAAGAAGAPAVTVDGTPVKVLLNVADAGELEGLDPGLCDGIGLVRTELLFHSGTGLPDEDTQYTVYRRILEWAQGRPVTVRTLDAGGDKPIAGLTLDGEMNPFLGVRGLRLCFARPDVFMTQLRALARAATHGELKVMLPMVTLPVELTRARAMLGEAVQSLRAQGVPTRMPALGIMVEVPACAVTADLFDADFYSIGSNDLAQYVGAAGRDMPSLAELADPVQPAMLRLIAGVVAAARARAVDVSLCGDAGGDPAAIACLLGAGLRMLSMAPALVGRAKLAIAECDLRDAPGGGAWPK
jgi:phosphoenolpyruvate-protein phosphotransferase (PTS system enzyme I)